MDLRFVFEPREREKICQFFSKYSAFCDVPLEDLALG